VGSGKLDRGPAVDSGDIQDSIVGCRTSLVQLHASGCYTDLEICIDGGSTKNEFAGTALGNGANTNNLVADGGGFRNLGYLNAARLRRNGGGAD